MIINAEIDYYKMGQTGAIDDNINSERYKKHLENAFKHGMGMAHSKTDNPNVSIKAFSKGDTKFSDTIILENKQDEEHEIFISMKGTKHDYFKGFINDDKDRHSRAGNFSLINARLEITIPKNSIISLFGI